MRRTALAVVVLLCACTPSSAQQQADEWTAPPSEWVSDLGRYDKRFTYNESSSISDGGRWVVFTSHVKDGPRRIFLVNTTKETVRQLDRAHDGGQRLYEGVRRNDLTGIHPQISPSGRFVVFTSGFSNLVRRDNNEAVDVFLYDRMERSPRIVNRLPNGRQMTMGSYNPSISSDGRYVVFSTRAKGLVPEDTDHDSDVYRKDLESGELELVSLGTDGKSDGTSSGADISSDGNRISFTSDATNLVEDDTNDLWDVFVRDMSEGRTIRASVTSGGEQYESFESEESASVYQASVGGAQISDDGEVVVFTGNANRLVEDDVNYNDDVFIHRISTRVTERVSVRSDGGDGYGDEESIECGKNPVCAQFMSTHSPSISADGSRIYFISAAPLLSDEDDDSSGGSTEQVFVHDTTDGRTLLVSRYRDGSPVESSNWYAGAISADGEWVTYSNNSTKLDGPKGDQDPGPDVFLQDFLSTDLFGLDDGRT